MKNDLKARQEYHGLQAAADRAAVRQATARGVSQISKAADAMPTFALAGLALNND